MSIVVLAACGGDGPAGDWSQPTPDSNGFDTTPDTTPMMSSQKVSIDPGTTNDAELVSTLSVGQTESGADRKVVMRLGSSMVPALLAGDRIITPAEVQVTTRCDIGQTAPGCDYNPTVSAQIMLTGNPDDTTTGGASKALSQVQTQSCTKADHHCTFTFAPGDATLDVDNSIPCVASNSCVVNLVMWAWDSHARSGGVDKVLVGQNNGDYLQNGQVDGDSGRIMIVRERGITPADRAMHETDGSGDQSINLSANPEIVYSHPLKPGDLVAGEQFLIEAQVKVSVSGRARFATQLVVSRSPNGSDNSVNGITPTAISEQNGYNCTDGTSPCTSHKVAVLRADSAVSGPVYVNVVVKSAVPGGGAAQVTVHRGDGWVRSVRYSANLAN